MGDDRVQIKVECKEVDPCENSRAVHISPHNSETVIDSENTSVNANRKSNMSFPTNHQPRSCVTPNFPKMVFRFPNLLLFSQKFLQETLQVKLPAVKLLRNHTYRTVSALQGKHPVPVKFGPTGTNPQWKNARF